MTGRPVAGRQNPPPSGGMPPRQEQSQPTYTTRQNEYFVPRDGIDREVITADICRYLGNDALVRPGVYENKETGQVVQGYYITAYRNLTSAMIEDLKADSARWENERRQQASARNSGASYRNSEVHAHRRDYGPSDPGGYGDSHGYDNQPRYPGSGAPGYSGAAGNHSYGPGPQQGGYAGGPSAGAFPPPPNQYGQPAGAFPSTLPGADTRYATGASGGMNPPFGPQDPPYVSTGVSYAATSAPAPFPADTFGRTDPMVGAPRDRLGNNPATTVAQPRGSTYHTAGGPSGAYPGAATGGPYYPQAPPAAYPTQPLDPFHGRRPYSDSEPSPSALATSSPDYTMGGTNDAPYGYRGPHSVHDQYEDPSTQPRTASTGTSTQQVAANSGAPVRRNDRDRDRDRAERDREAERHAAERRHQHAARR